MNSVPSAIQPFALWLTCPQCGHRHVDEGEWAKRPHKSHLCANCGLIWRPSNEYTVGVLKLPETGDITPRTH